MSEQEQFIRDAFAAVLGADAAEQSAAVEAEVRRICNAMQFRALPPDKSRYAMSEIVVSLSDEQN